MATVYVSIGSNINREHHVTESLKALHDRFAPLHISKFYDCEPVGFKGDNFKEPFCEKRNVGEHGDRRWSYDGKALR